MLSTTVTEGTGWGAPVCGQGCLRTVLNDQRWKSWVALYPTDALQNYTGGNLTVTGPKETASIFATYPAPYLSLNNGFLDQVGVRGRAARAPIFPLFPGTPANGSGSGCNVGLCPSLHHHPPQPSVLDSQMTWGGGLESLGERGQMEYPAANGSPSASVNSKVLGTGILIVGLLAILDKRNKGVPAGLEPIAVGLLVLVITLTMGANCGSPLNPARDLGPRLFTYVAGWGPEVFRWEMASSGAVLLLTSLC